MRKPYIRGNTPLRKTTDTFEKEVYDKTGTEYLFQDEYAGYNKKLTVMHSNCGTEYMASPSRFLKGLDRCTTCYPRLLGYKVTQEIYEQRVKDMHGDDYTVVGKFTRSVDPITILHNECGREFDIEAGSFVNMGIVCRYCSDHVIQKTDEEFKQEVWDAVGDEYTTLEPYTKSSERIKMRHNICGFTWSLYPMSFTSIGSRCPKCSGLLCKTTERFKAEVAAQVGTSYSVLGEYHNSYTHIEMKHNICGHKWKVQPASFTHTKSRCPKCAWSTGETKVAEHLDSIGVTYINEYSYSDCRDKSILPFDFYLPDYNMLIEYDGIHHYKPVDLFGGEDNLVTVQAHDYIKDRYAKSNDINLLRIPYTEFNNIESIIDKALKEIEEGRK